MNENQLKKIIKEELMKEMDIGTGLAIVGGGFLALKGLAYLVAVVSGIKNGINAGLEESKFQMKALGALILDPQINTILKKLRDNDEIINPLTKGRLDEAAQKIEESGLLTPEEMKIIKEKFNFTKSAISLHNMSTRMKHKLPLDIDK